MTGGMAYEGENNSGVFKNRLIVVLMITICQSRQMSGRFQIILLNDFLILIK